MGPGRLAFEEAAELVGVDAVHVVGGTVERTHLTVLCRGLDVLWSVVTRGYVVLLKRQKRSRVRTENRLSARPDNCLTIKAGAIGMVWIQFLT